MTKPKIPSKMPKLFFCQFRASHSRKLREFLSENWRVVAIYYYYHCHDKIITALHFTSNPIFNGIAFWACIAREKKNWLSIGHYMPGALIAPIEWMILWFLSFIIIIIVMNIDTMTHQFYSTRPVLPLLCRYSQSQSAPVSWRQNVPNRITTSIWTGKIPRNYLHAACVLNLWTVMAKWPFMTDAKSPLERNQTTNSRIPYFAYNKFVYLCIDRPTEYIYSTVAFASFGSLIFFRFSWIYLSLAFSAAPIRLTV